VRSTCAKGWDTNDLLKSGRVGTNLTAQPRQARAPLAEPGSTLRKKRAKVQRKYTTLASVFMKAKPTSQILSVYLTKDSSPQKVLDYKAALAAGDCSLPDNPPQNILDRLKVLEIDISQQLVH